MKKKNWYFQIIVPVIFFQRLLGCKDVPEVLTELVTNAKVTEATAGDIVLADFKETATKLIEVFCSGVHINHPELPTISAHVTDASGMRNSFQSIMIRINMSNTIYSYL